MNGNQLLRICIITCPVLFLINIDYNELDDIQLPFFFKCLKQFLAVSLALMLTYRYMKKYYVLGYK